MTGSRTPENDNCLLPLSEDCVRLEIFELQPRSANVVAGEKIDVAFRQSVARTVENRSDRLQRMRIVLGRLRLGDAPVRLRGLRLGSETRRVLESEASVAVLERASPLGDPLTHARLARPSKRLARKMKTEGAAHR